MSASKINPNTWQGQERSSGYLARNDHPKSASAPEWRGRIYLIGVGWFWLSGWIKEGRGGPMLSLRAEEMNDEQATKFCAPRVNGKSKPAPQATRRKLFPDDGAPLPPGNDQSEIPF